MLYQILPIFRGMKPIIERINGFADYEEEDVTGKQSPSFKSEISVKNLCFGYNQERDIICDMSLDLKKGEKYALIGESGSGKSTFIRILSGTYDEYRGQVLYDGVELRNLNRNELYKSVAVIHQNIFLFDDTIRNNICLNEEFTQGQLEWALERTGEKRRPMRNRKR